jgi:flagellar motor component MotA
MEHILGYGILVIVYLIIGGIMVQGIEKFNFLTSLIEFIIYNFIFIVPVGLILLAVHLITK